jgi:GABA(A) receptor-associated protein
MSRHLPTELLKFEARQARAVQLSIKYPNRLPLIIKPVKVNGKVKGSSSSASSSADGPVIKFIVSYTCTVAEVLFRLRKSININEYQAIYLCVGDCVLSGSMSIDSIFDRYKSDDGFLYLEYCQESVFGSSSHPSSI